MYDCDTKNVREVDPKNENFRRSFWDDKILEWENDKYHKSRVFDVNSSLKFRREIAIKSLQKICFDKKIIELGCGSAETMIPLIRAGAAQYVGIDISKRAVEKAKDRARAYEVEGKVELINSDVSQLGSYLNGDICFSLGFIDWINEEEILSIFRKTKSMYHIHSYSEKSYHYQQLLHCLYVFFKYGHREKSYTPNYLDRNRICDIFTRATGVSPRVYSDRRLSFGKLIHNLPCEIERECDQV